MSLARNGNTDIYEMNLKLKKMERLTNYPGIDTAPSYSPDGDFITFESDRSGSQKIYVMSLKTKKIKRISFGKGKYATPVWSPRGDLIAFTKQLVENFILGLCILMEKVKELFTNLIWLKVQHGRQMEGFYHFTVKQIFKGKISAQK